MYYLSSHHCRQKKLPKWKNCTSSMLQRILKYDLGILSNCHYLLDFIVPYRLVLPVS